MYKNVTKSYLKDLTCKIVNCVDDGIIYTVYNLEKKLKYTDARKYREAVGSLIYLTTCTRQDLGFVVSKLSQYFSEPTEEHWTTVKHILRYLKGTIEKELSYRKRNDEKLGLHAYSDTDWAADKAETHCTSDYCISQNENGPLTSWKTKKQPTVAFSTCEEEYMALTTTTLECGIILCLTVDSRVR